MPGDELVRGPDIRSRVVLRETILSLRPNAIMKKTILREARCAFGFQGP